MLRTVTERTLQRELEWEAAATLTVLEHVALPVPPFMPGVTKLTIERDDNLQLALVADGTLAPGSGEIARRHHAAKAIPLGMFQPSIEVLLDAYGSQLELKMHLAEEPSSLRMSPSGTTYQQEGLLERMHRRYSQKVVFANPDDEVPSFIPMGKAAWRSDWYINGTTFLYFPRRTRRRQLAAFKRERESHTVGFDEFPGGSDAWDHIVVETPVARFAYCKVPEEAAPTGLQAVSIEYLDPIPNKDVREGIGEIVSFVLGRRMMLVGSTTFDASGRVIEEESVNPWGNNVRDLCRGTDHPPIEFNHHGSVLEGLLADLVPRYLAAREQLGLRDAMWSYWIAKESPVSVDLPIFAAAVECVKRSWLASAQSTSKGLHLTKDAFETLAGDLITELRKRVETRRVPQEIINTVAGANRMGSGEQMRTFLKEVGLPVGEREKAAMRARHRSAHGAIGDEGLAELVRLGIAYRTLFDRVLLRLLSYEGEYVDRTTEGHPSRPLATPAGGE